MGDTNRSTRLRYPRGRTPSGADVDFAVDAHGNTKVTGPDGEAVVGEGQLSVSGALPGSTPIRTTRATNTNSTTRATMLTPTTGTRIRIISVNMSFVATTSNGVEVYFGDGANIGSDVTKAVTEARQAGIGPVFEGWLDGAGPVGALNEVLSLRGSLQVNEDVDVIVVYREESE